jgi:hypothetical protein
VECDLQVAILVSAQSYQLPNLEESSILPSVWEDIGIESRGSNQRVAYNKFYTDTGILNHAGSILNMGNAAKKPVSGRI